MKKYTSIKEIEDTYAEPENESKLAKIRRIKSKNQAINRFNKRQQQQESPIETRPSIQTQSQTAASSTTPQTQIRSRITESATLRKQKSRKELTINQRRS